MKRNILLMAAGVMLLAACGDKSAEENSDANSENTAETVEDDSNNARDDEENSNDMVTGEVRLVEPGTFLKAIKDTSVVLIDVRTPEEVEKGYIAGMININYSSDEFQENLDKLDRTQAYAVYCHGGGRSGNTAEMMMDMGFDLVYDLDGGFGSWEHEGFPVAK